MIVMQNTKTIPRYCSDDKAIWLKLLQIFSLIVLFASIGWLNNVAKTKPAVFSVKDFPLGVGSQWVYVRVDSSSSGFFPQGVTKKVVVETVTVKIIGQTKTAEDGTISIWIREFRSRVDTRQNITLSGVERPPSKERPPKVDTSIQQALTTPNYLSVDTQYVTSIGDTVIFSKRFRIHTDTTRPLYLQELSRFVFSLVVGNSWKGAYPDDSFAVSRKESIEVIQNEFKPGFHIERRSWIPNSYGEAAYWIVPEIGVVRNENRHEFTFGNVYGIERWRLIRYEVKK